MGVIRLLLALCVVAGHSAPLFGLRILSGEMAVQAFYIISGFYMSLILTEKYIGKNNSYKLFITNRFLRLYPIYWVVLIMSVAACFVVAAFSPDNNHLQLENYFSVNFTPGSFLFLVATNLVIFGQDLVMFLGINPADGHLFFTSNFRETSPPLYTFLFIWQAWTLGLELMFYLVAPFILRRNVKFLIGLIIGSILLRAFLYYQLDLTNDPWTYRFFPTELVFFLLGNVAYMMYNKLKTMKLPKYLGPAMLVGVLFFTLTYNRIPNWLCPEFPRRLLYYAAIVLSIPVLFNMYKKNKFDNMIGELSYPVYISHMLIIAIIWQLNLNSFKNGFLICTLSVILSILLNRFIAKPIEKLRQSRVARRLAPATNGSAEVSFADGTFGKKKPAQVEEMERAQ